MEYTVLNNGVRMPMVGYGVYRMSGEECARCVRDALQVGYRLIDTAQIYGNEAGVGAGIRASGVDRKEIFLTTKVWISHYTYDQCRASVMESLDRLQTDYLDLCLLHQPFADYYSAYRALEDLYREGKIRAIGVSNFYADRLVDLASFAAVCPAVNQLEIHPLFPREESRQWNETCGVQLQAWAPFGSGLNGVLQRPEVLEIADRYGKSPAQVILRWNLQRGVASVPKSSHVERMAENLNIFDFALTDSDMARIAELGRAQQTMMSHRDPAIVAAYAKRIKEGT